MAEWSAVVNTTATRYLKGASDSTIRDRLIFAMMSRRKRIMYNWDGTDVTQQVKFSLPEVEAYSGGTIDFDPADKYRQINLDWRGYKVSDVMTEKEKLMNRGVPRLVNRYSNIMKDMRQALEDQFGVELYIDGNASGNTARMHGLESFMGGDGNAVLADIIESPSDVYGGLNTELGNQGGTWSTALVDASLTPPNANNGSDWPTGTGDPEHDFISPRLFNWSSSSWGTGSSGATSWIDNCERVIRKAIITTRLTTGKNGRADVAMLNDDLYYDYLNKQEAKQRIVVPHKEVEDLGFEGAKQEGVSIVTEFGMAASTGYLLNIDKMHMRCLYGQLFMPRGPEYSIERDAYLFLMGWFGNLYFEPKFFSKFYPYAAS